jgi:putative hydrolase of the HAD superfamily
MSQNVKDHPALTRRRALARPQIIAFDLDETVYPRQAGVMQAIGQRITLYLEQYLGMSHAEALAERKRLTHKYGTTLRGLQLERGISADEYLTFVHDVPVEQLVSYDARLDQALARIEADKVIFTNASREHAERVLHARGVRRHFSRIFDIRDLDWVCKPHPTAYLRLLTLLNAPASQCMLVEDNERNLRPAAEIGMSTVLVDAQPEDGVADFVIDELWQIADVYAGLPR